MTYNMVIGIVGYETHKLSLDSVNLLFNMAYIVIGPVLTLAGYAFTFDAWKRRIQTGQGSGLALWNTGASVYNTISLVRFLKRAIKVVFDGFRKSPAAFAVLGIFLAALFGGILTTYLLVKHYAKNDRLAPIEDSLHTAEQYPNHAGYASPVDRDDRW